MSLPLVGSALIPFLVRELDLVPLGGLTSWVFSAFPLFDTTSFSLKVVSFFGVSFLTFFFVVLSERLLTAETNQTPVSFYCSVHF